MLPEQLRRSCCGERGVLVEKKKENISYYSITDIQCSGPPLFAPLAPPITRLPSLLELRERERERLTSKVTVRVTVTVTVA